MMSTDATGRISERDRRPAVPRPLSRDWKGAGLPRRAARLAGIACALLAAGCRNSPYPDSDEGRNVLYTTFTDEPRHMDPAQSYSSLESIITYNILEPPFQYHYLKRPYELDGLTATEVPRPERRSVIYRGRTIEATVYTIRLKRGIRYQDHPCFVERNRRLTERDVRGVRGVRDLPATATREAVAGDFVHGIHRLADPRLACPIYDTLARNLLGMDGYRDALQESIDRRRRLRTQAAGPLYNQEADEQYDPIRIDYAAGAEEFPFVREIDPHTFEVVLRHPYPQVLYWMAMTFFAPVPPEAIEFYNQRVLLERSILFDKNPVGTGPYVLREFDPANQIVLVRNGNFRPERYPSLPPPSESDPHARALYAEMKSAGMLDDAGKALPMVDRIVYRMERESIPRWNKFLQGYYDSSGIQSDVFDQAVTLTSRGDSTLTDELARRGIRLLTSHSAAFYFYAFNMDDPVVGGFAEPNRKLRQAVSIAFNVEDEIAIFDNGRGAAAHSPIPPGIFGHEPGRAGINPVVYRWDPKRNRAVRRPLEEAKKLLAEAGYPDGYGPDGQPLTLRFATTWRSPEGRTRVKFIQKQFAKLNVRLAVETYDHNRFGEKVRSGSYQIVRYGWAGDYPDPENFLFLFQAPESTEADKQNVPRYRSDEYDRLFVRMRSMENSPQRLAIIRQMLAVLRADAPAILDYHPVAYGLYHKWYGNAYPHAMASHAMKYARIDVAARRKYRIRHNKPVWWPVATAGVLFVLFGLPAVRVAVRHFREA